MALGVFQWLILKFNISASLLWYVNRTIFRKCLGFWLDEWNKWMCFVKSSESSRAEVAQDTASLGICFKKLTECLCDCTAWTGNVVSCAAQPKDERGVMVVIRTMYFILSLDILTMTTCDYMEPTFWFLFCFHNCLLLFAGLKWERKGGWGCLVLNVETVRSVWLLLLN